MKNHKIDLIENIRATLSDDPYDLGYFETHKRRYFEVFSLIHRNLNQLSDNVENMQILELGSYHLHLLSMLKLAGYENLYGLDLPSLVDKELIRERAQNLGITNSTYTMNEIGKPIKIPYEEDQFDVIICLEMLEHLTFNPIRFWQEIFRISSDRCILFIATPNAMSFIKWLSRIKKLVLRNSYGISLDEIFVKITSGHHWKEYSPGEMKRYFIKLDNIFRFENIESYRWRSYGRFNKWIQLLYAFQEKILPIKFRSEMFYIYRVDKKQEMIIEDPDEQFYRAKDK